MSHGRAILRGIAVLVLLLLLQRILHTGRWHLQYLGLGLRSKLTLTCSLVLRLESTRMLWAGSVSGIPLTPVTTSPGFSPN